MDKENSLTLAHIYGSVLTANHPEKRDILATFECDKYPNCDCCDIDERTVKRGKR